MNAVVIDNEPRLPILDNSHATGQQTATLVDDGMGGVAHTVQDMAEETSGVQLEDHSLDITSLSDSFADQGIACAFVFPKDGDDDETKSTRVLKAVATSDLVIIDWYLSKKSPLLTRKLLTKIASKDAAEKGRMRLICVYTGQPEVADVTRLAIESLKKGNLNFNVEDIDAGFAQGPHHLLVVLNKKQKSAQALPEYLINEFTKLADGLLPVFALSAVAAIRKNVHHIAARFSAELDPAYVANRLITDPPHDITELMRELFISECDSALGLEKVSDLNLEPEHIKLWLDAKNQPKNEQEDNGFKVDRMFLHGLNYGRVCDKEAILNIHNPSEDITRQKLNAKKRGLISLALQDSEDAGLRRVNTERRFARLVSFKREMYGENKLSSDHGWQPTLTLGSIIKLYPKLEASSNSDSQEIQPEYFYCLTPLCDTVRLYGNKQKFIFLRLESGRSKKVSLLLEEKGKSEPTKLCFEPTPSNIEVFCFIGDLKLGRVLATKNMSTDELLFTDTEENSFEWLGEVRISRAMRDMAELNRTWLRFGINDSEYLRLASRGEVDI
jgi:hypothetical protein